MKPGKNELGIKITNRWINRMIGDEQYPEEAEYQSVKGGFHKGTWRLTKWPDWWVEGKPRPEGPRVAFSTWKHYDKNSPLVQSGLIGPVRLRIANLYVIEGK